MDLRQLRYFSVLAETLNFNRAAARLNMAQPPLSVAIRKLEEDLGTALFERESRGVRLTSAGEAALGPARAVLTQAEEVRVVARQGAEGLRGRLRLGFVGSSVSELLPRIISSYRKEFSGVDLELEELTSREIVRSIAARRIDVGLVRMPLMEAGALDAEVIERDWLVIAVPKTSFLATDRPVPLAALADQPFIAFGPVSVLSVLTRLACQEAGFVARIAQEAVQVQTILSLVQAGLGIALVPSKTCRFAPEGVQFVELAEEVAIAMGIVCAVDAGPLARRFVAHAMQNSDTERVSTIGN